MPLYDFRCEHCEGIFEQRVPIARISTDTIECNYCQQQTLAKPMITCLLYTSPSPRDS